MARPPHHQPAVSVKSGRSHRRHARLSLFAVSTAALAGLALPAIHHPRLRFIWNASASVPLGLYRVVTTRALRVGDTVAVRPSPQLARFMATRRYVEANVPLLKPIAATEGATVCRVDLRVTINGRTTVSALPRDRVGRPLPVWSGCYRLRPHQLFLIAPSHPDSFDSRYFGPVDRSQILGRAASVWTWS